MRRILITGGAGFIGRALGERILEYKEQTAEDIQVRTIDLAAGAVEGAEHLKGSIMDITDLNEAAEGCDTVVHLAALLGVEKTERRRLDCLSVNIQGTLNVLNAAAKDGVKKVLFTSSSEVYGEQTNIPITEENPLNPRSIYAITKLAGEEYVRTYGQRYGMKTTVFRLFNIYGAHQVGQFVISRFVKAVQEDQPPLLYGRGDQVRAFCYMSDAADGMARALFSDKADGMTLHLGNPTEPVTMKELAERVIRISGKTLLKPKFVSEKEMDRRPDRDIQRRIPSIEKAREVLGYEPKVSLDEGIRRIMEQGKVVPSWTDHRKG